MKGTEKEVDLFFSWKIILINETISLLKSEDSKKHKINNVNFKQRRKIITKVP